MDLLFSFLLSLSIPLLGAFALSSAQRFFAAQCEEMHVAIALFMALAWLMIGAVFLCFTQQLNPIGVGLVYVSGMIVFSTIGKRPTIPKIKWYVLLLLGPYFAMALIPPWYRDSLTYHLALPRLFAGQSGYTPTDEIIFAYFPLGWQSLLAMIHCLGVDGFALFNPRLVTVWTCGALAFGTVGLCKQFGASNKAAYTAGVTLLLVPTQIEFGTSCYVQSWLTLLSILAFSGFVMRGKNGAILSGCAAGLAASTKYSGLFICLLLGILWLRENKNRWRFILYCTILGAPFYIKNLLLKGNPIFPLGYATFGGEGWDQWRADAYKITLQNYGMGREISDYMALPFRLFQTKDMIYFFQGSLGAVVGVAVLLCFWGTWKNRSKIWFSGTFYIIGWSILWALQVQQVRFYMPVVPVILAMGCATIYQKMNIPVLGLWFATMLFWTIPSGEYLWERQQTTQYLTKQISTQEFLKAQLPHNYQIYQNLKKYNPTKVWLVWMKEYAYYLDYPARIDSVFGAWRFEQLLDEYGEDPEKVRQILQSEEISHIVVHLKAFLVNGNADLTVGRTNKLQQAFMRLLQQGKISPVEKYSHPVRVPHKSKIIEVSMENNKPVVLLEFVETGKKIRVTQLDNVAQINAGQTLEANTIIGTEPTVMIYSVSSENSFLPSEVKPQ